MSLQPYRPSLYLPGSLGRYRQYPRVTRTPIPGAGYHVGDLVWGEQVLDLDGRGGPYPYGQYRSVPLRGLGNDATVAQVASIADTTARIIRDPEGTMRTQGPQIVAALDRHVVDPLVERMAEAAAPYMVKYVLPPMAILYVLSGLAAFYSFKSLTELRGGKLKANARRRRKRR